MRADAGNASLIQHDNPVSVHDGAYPLSDNQNGSFRRFGALPEDWHPS